MNNAKQLPNRNKSTNYELRARCEPYYFSLFFSKPYTLQNEFRSLSCIYLIYLRRLHNEAPLASVNVRWDFLDLQECGNARGSVHFCLTGLTSNSRTVSPFYFSFINASEARSRDVIHQCCPKIMIYVHLSKRKFHSIIFWNRLPACEQLFLMRE